MFSPVPGPSAVEDGGRKGISGGIASVSQVPVSSMTATELIAGYAAGELDPVAVVSEVLERATAAGERYSAVAAIAPTDSVLAEAEASASRWREGRPLSAIDGVPVSVKESIPMAGFPRRHGSAAHEPVFPTGSAPIIQRIAEAGGLIFATTTMPDFGLLASGVSSAYGVIRNPWDPAMNTGGSSAGAGALVAAGVGPLSVGTDMAGSVRIPAAHHGLCGMKPTQGRIAYSSSVFRSAGPLARTVDDMEALLGVIGREDDADPTCLPGRYTPRAMVDVRKIHVGLMRQIGLGSPAGSDEVAAAEHQAAILAEAGATVVDVDPPGLNDGDAEALATLFYAKALAELHTVPAGRRSLVLPAVAEVADAATGLSALALEQAVERVGHAKLRLLALFEHIDFLVTPALATAAFSAELPFPDGHRGPYDNVHFPAWFNQTGQPAGVVPGGSTPHGMPVGVQIVGARFADADVVQMMRFLQAAGAPLEYPTLDTKGVSR